MFFHAQIQAERMVLWIELLMQYSVIDTFDFEFYAAARTAPQNRLFRKDKITWARKAEAIIRIIEENQFELDNILNSIQYVCFFSPPPFPSPFPHFMLFCHFDGENLYRKPSIDRSASDCELLYIYKYMCVSKKMWSNGKSRAIRCRHFLPKSSNKWRDLFEYVDCDFLLIN